jgi:hypothetical protein
MVRTCSQYASKGAALWPDRIGFGVIMPFRATSIMMALHMMCRAMSSISTLWPIWYRVGGSQMVTITRLGEMSYMP